MGWIGMGYAGYGIDGHPGLGARGMKQIRYEIETGLYEVRNRAGVLVGAWTCFVTAWNVFELVP